MAADANNGTQETQSICLIHVLNRSIISLIP